MRVIVCENHLNNMPWRIIDMITLVESKDWFDYSQKYALAGHKKVSYMPADDYGKKWYASHGYV